MILSLLLILTPPEQPNCFTTIYKIRHEAKMKLFEQWLKKQKTTDDLIRENQELIKHVNKLMGEKWS